MQDEHERNGIVLETYRKISVRLWTYGQTVQLMFTYVSNADNKSESCFFE